MTHRRSVPSGQRHSMLIHCNTLFERRIGGNTRQTNNDGQCMAKNNTDDNTTLSQSTMTNNGKQRGLTNPFHSSKYIVITISNMFIMLLAENDGPSIQPPSTTPAQPLFDDTGNLQFFQHSLKYLRSFIYCYT